MKSNHTCIEEVMASKQIESQATFIKSPVKWEDCVPPYAVDERAFMNHTRGAKKVYPVNQILVCVLLANKWPPHMQRTDSLTLSNMLACWSSND